jgi:hypothetical protein
VPSWLRLTAIDLPPHTLAPIHTCIAAQLLASKGVYSGNALSATRPVSSILCIESFDWPSNEFSFHRFLPNVKWTAQSKGEQYAQDGEKFLANGE